MDKKEKMALILNDLTEKEIEKLEAERNTFTDDSLLMDVYSDEQVKLIKYNFQKNHGTDDSYYIYEETDEIRTKVNGYRGIIQILDKTDNSSFEINVFDSLNEISNPNSDLRVREMEELRQSKAPSRPTSWKTNGPDFANMTVKKGSKRDSIKIIHPSLGYPKSYTKDTNNWYSGYTKGYYNNIHEARKCWGTATSTVNANIRQAMYAVGLQFVKKGQKPSTKAFISATQVYMGSNSLPGLLDGAGYAVAYFGHIIIANTNFLNI